MAPGDCLAFRLVGFNQHDPLRGVLMSPGNGNPFGYRDWLPRARYIMKVKVFGNGTLPVEDTYEIDFPSETQVTFDRHNPRRQPEIVPSSLPPVPVAKKEDA